ncbi:MAG: hypothetical protein QOH44_1437 [Actinomycetota bacterium]|nr:hypothetical protein [Actinomycetota bacterium]
MGEMRTGVAFAARDSAHFDTGFAAAANALGSLVDEVVEAEFVIGLAMARRAKAIERASKYSEGIAASQPTSRSTPPSAKSTAASRDMARRSFVAEMAAALRIPDRTADRLIQTSHTLVSELPSTLTALGDGRLSYRHAQILADNTYSLDPASVRELESRMLGVAEKKTPSQFERSVRRTRERLHPETMIERQVLADSERAVELMPERDGMVFIGGHVSSVLGVAIDERLTAIARSLQQKDVLGTVETRTLTQLKADVFTDLLLDVDGQEGLDGRPATSAGRGAGSMSRYRSIRPKVLVTVPASTVLRLGGGAGRRLGDASGVQGQERGTEPGELEGYGPIDPQTAREIASLAKSWQKLVTDPVTGIVLRMGRKRYRIPKDLRIWLRVRDGTCRFPGCSRSAIRCDLDHTVDWFALDGRSDHDNLAHLCRGHHSLKHASDWSVEQLAGGILRWTSPAGIRYETDPELELAS